MNDHAPYCDITTVRALLERMLANPKDDLVFSNGRYWFASVVGRPFYVDEQQAKLCIALDLLAEVAQNEWHGPGVGYRCTLTGATGRG